MRRSFALPALLVLTACPQGDFSVQTLEPEIAVSPPEIAFGDAAVPFAHTEDLYITNAGKADLEVTVRWAPKLDVFAFTLPTDADPIVIAPEESLAIPITFMPPTYLPYETELLITSNDAQNEQIIVPVSGLGVYVALPDIEVSTPAVDFGAVDANNTGTQFLEVRNLGDAALQLADVTIDGDPAFRLLSDPSGGVVGAGDVLPVVLAYTPSDLSGDQATLRITSDDPDEPEVDVILIGNGGDGFELPVAVIDCPADAAPPEYVTLDGSASYDPGGDGIVTYSWALVGRPDGSQAAFTSADGALTQVFADSAGPYDVMLQVMNGAGIWSDPTICSFEAIPADALHVELTWDGLSSDVDLHVREDGADLFEVPGDACFCNDFPSWGDSGTDDDPRLDLDDRAGKGPENINILAPQDGLYHVAVHYYSKGYDGLVTATVRVYVYGVLVHEGSQLLDLEDKWEVGTMDWAAGTFTTDGTVEHIDRKTCF